jgi:hypothetical protein
MSIFVREEPVLWYAPRLIRDWLARNYLSVAYQYASIHFFYTSLAPSQVLYYGLS